MQAVILAGGLGTRFRPLTLNTPKPMIPVMGKPYLEYQLQYLKRFNISDILLCIGYLGEKIHSYFGSGHYRDMSITYSFEKKPLGTGGALKNAERYLDDRFYLIYGDSFLPINFSYLEKQFYKADKTVLMVLYDNRENTSVPNNVSLDARGVITHYEKGTGNRNLHYVDAGVLALKKKILDSIPQGKKVSLEREVFPDLITRQECAGVVTGERFYDIGTPERLKHFETYVNNFEFENDEKKELSKRRENASQS